MEVEELIERINSIKLTDKEKAICIEDANIELQLGVPNTAESQLLQIKEHFIHEIQHSKTFRDILSLIYENYEKEKIPIRFYVGKNSAGFVDSSVNWTFDVDDLLMFPTSYFDSDDQFDEKKGRGITKGEALMHVLEERMYMKYPDCNFNKSHFNCLIDGSFQQKYRKEMRGKGVCLIFNIDEREFDENDRDYKGDRTDLVADFRSVASDGSVFKIIGVPILKGTFPERFFDFEPKFVKKINLNVDFGEFADKEIGIVLDKFIDKANVIPVYVFELIQWISFSYGKEKLEALWAIVLHFQRIKLLKSIITRWKLAKNEEDLKRISDKSSIEKMIFSHFKNVQNYLESNFEISLGWDEWERFNYFQFPFTHKISDYLQNSIDELIETIRNLLQQKLGENYEIVFNILISYFNSGKCENNQE